MQSADMTSEAKVTKAFYWKCPRDCPSPTRDSASSLCTLVVQKGSYWEEDDEEVETGSGNLWRIFLIEFRFRSSLTLKTRPYRWCWCWKLLRGGCWTNQPWAAHPGIQLRAEVKEQGNDTFEMSSHNQFGRSWSSFSFFISGKFLLSQCCSKVDHHRPSGVGEIFWRGGTAGDTYIEDTICLWMVHCRVMAEKKSHVSLL